MRCKTLCVCLLLCVWMAVPGLSAGALATGTADAFSAALPVLQDSTVVYPGNWTVYRGTWSDDPAQQAYPTWTHTGAHAALTQYEQQAFYTDLGLWGEEGECYGFLYENGRMVVCPTADRTGMGVVYRAPQDGVVTLSFSQLLARWQTNSATIQAMQAAGEVPHLSCYLAITLNGEVIWPSDGHPFLYDSEVVRTTTTKANEDMLAAAETYEPFPLLYLSAGDEVAFIGNQGNIASQMMQIMPEVTYLATDTTPATLTVSASLHEALALSFQAEGQGDFSDVSITLDSPASWRAATAASQSGGAQWQKILATEMCQPVCYRVTGSWGGQRVLLDAGRVSLADYLCRLLQDGTQTSATRDLAHTLLSYGSAAMERFSVPGERPDAGVTYTCHDTALQEIDLAALTDEMRLVASSAAAGDRVVFTGARLLLQDTVQMQLEFRAPEEDFTGLTISCTVGEKTFSLVPQQTGAQTGRVTLAIPASAYAVSYTFTPCWGTAQAGPALTYSVQSYAVRMAQSEDKDMLSCIIALGRATATYASGMT